MSCRRPETKKSSSICLGCPAAVAIFLLATPTPKRCCQISLACLFFLGKKFVSRKAVLSAMFFMVLNPNKIRALFRLVIRCGKPK